MRNKSGFTIIEVLIVIVIMAVMMGMGFNYIIGWLPNYRARNAARDIHSTRHSARMTAIKEHKRCTVTFTKSGGEVDGYVVYFDANDDLQYNPADDGKAIKKVSMDDYKGDVWFDTSQSGDGVTLNNDSVTFLSNGLIDTAATGNSGKNVYLKNSTGREWQVSVSAAGGVKIESGH